MPAFLNFDRVGHDSVLNMVFKRAGSRFDLRLVTNIAVLRRAARRIGGKYRLKCTWRARKRFRT